MNDREFNEQKKRIQALIDKWKDPLGLGWWQINFNYCREGEIERTHGDDPEARFTALMDVQSEWQYLHASVRVNMPKLAQVDDEDLEQSFVHELMHIYVSEMQVPAWADAPAEIIQSLRDHEERVVTMLARAVCWVRQQGYEEGRKAERKEQAERAKEASA